MSVMQPAGAAAFLARYEGLRERLPGDREARDRAAAFFRAAGSRPCARRPGNTPASRPVPRGRSPSRCSRSRTARICSPNCRYWTARASCSWTGGFVPNCPLLPDAVETGTFAEAAISARWRGRTATPLVALNTMLAEDGAVIAVPDGVDAGLVQLISIATDVPGSAVAFHPRHSVRLGRGAQADAGRDVGRRAAPICTIP